MDLRQYSQGYAMIPPAPRIRGEAGGNAYLSNSTFQSFEICSPLLSCGENLSQQILNFLMKYLNINGTILKSSGSYDYFD